MKGFFKNSVFILILLLSLTAFYTQLLSAEKGGFPISSGSCINAGCHSDMTKKKYVHSIITDGSQCTECHEMPKEKVHAFTLMAEGGALCGLCHEGVSDKKYNHPPVSEGECTSCHDPHQSNHPQQLLIPSTSQLCFLCHDEGEFKGTTPHGPVSEGGCLQCHDPHTSDHRALLEMPLPDICFNCHSTELDDQQEITLPATQELYDDEAMKLHMPFAEGACTDCHGPHPSDTYRLLKGEYPSQFYVSYSEKTYEFCLNCHDDLRTALSEPRTLTGTNFRNGNLNLHHRHVSRAKGRTCRSCHHHHGSPNQKLIKDVFVFGNSKLAIGFKKTDTGGRCTAGCHIPVAYDRYDPEENAMKTTPREGRDATAEELRRSRKRDSQ